MNQLIDYEFKLSRIDENINTSKRLFYILIRQPSSARSQKVWFWCEELELFMPR